METEKAKKAQIEYDKLKQSLSATENVAKSDKPNQPLQRLSGALNADLVSARSGLCIDGLAFFFVLTIPNGSCVPGAVK